MGALCMCVLEVKGRCVLGEGQRGGIKRHMASRERLMVRRVG